MLLPSVESNRHIPALRQARQLKSHLVKFLILIHFGVPFLRTLRFPQRELVSTNKGSHMFGFPQKNSPRTPAEHVDSVVIRSNRQSGAGWKRDSSQYVVAIGAQKDLQIYCACGAGRLDPHISRPERELVERDGSAVRAA